MNNMVIHSLRYFYKHITISCVFTLLMLYGFFYHGLMRYGHTLQDDRIHSFNVLVTLWLEPESDSIALEKLTNFDWEEVCIVTTSVTPSENYLKFTLKGRYVEGVFGQKPNMKLLQEQGPKLLSDCVSRKDAMLQKVESGFYLMERK